MLWLKALHIIFMVTWFAGLFYLPRIYVYLTAANEPAVRDTLLTMARRLYAITTIGMVATWIFGIALLFAVPAWMGSGWMHAKILLVLILSGYHGWLKVEMRAFANGGARRSERFWRIANEAPAVVLVGAVILAVVKPF